jgi:hypothetical protein
MKITIEFTETPEGNVEFGIGGNIQTCTFKERYYALAVVEVLKYVVPKIGEPIGCKGYVPMTGNAQQQ